MKIVRFDTLDSTNSEALRGDYPEGTVILADHQTQGRGQRGNVWCSEKSQNLTFSVVHYPDLPLSDSFRISMAAALSVTDLLSSFGIESRIKWPNDIYVGNKKIAGILIENSLSGSSLIRKSVIGIGLNVMQTEFPSNIPNPTSMALCGVKVSAEDVLSRLSFCFSDCFSDCFSEPVQPLYARYRNLMWRRDGFHLYSDAQGSFMARIADVDCATGRISLEREDGTISCYFFKEVSAIISKID